MKKIFVLVYFILFVIIANSQTYELEVVNLSNRYQNAEFNLDAYRFMRKDWEKLMVDIGGYPSLPYDTVAKIIKYEYQMVFPFSKNVIYERSLQWCAIWFNNVRFVERYANKDEGKIIMKGWFEVESDYDIFSPLNLEGQIRRKCNFVMIFTMADSNLKFEVINIEYEQETISKTNPVIVSFPIELVYPVTNHKDSKWKNMLSLLSNTSIKIQGHQRSLEKYILSYNDDYNFNRKSE